MVARTRPETGLRLTFMRDGEPIESDTVSTGEDAREAALAILGRLDALQDGDTLLVTEGHI
jgi:hypothetical protein